MSKTILKFGAIIRQRKPGAVIDGKRYSERTTELWESRDPEEILAIKGWEQNDPEGIFELCERQACEWLKGAHLPHETALRYWREIGDGEKRGPWQPLRAWPPRTKADRVEVRSLDDIVAAAGHKRDSYPDLAVRLLRRSGELRHALQFDKAPDIVRLAFSLGALWQLSGVYEIDSTAARESVAAKYDQKGGYREKKAQVRAAWASGKYESKDACARAESELRNLSFSTVRKYLRNLPEPT